MTNSKAPPNYTFPESLLHDYSHLFHTYILPKLLEMPLMHQISEFMRGTNLKQYLMHSVSFFTKYLQIISLLSIGYYFLKMHPMRRFIPRQWYSPIQEDLSFMQVECEDAQNAWMPLATRYIDPNGLPTGVGYIAREGNKMMHWAGASPNERILGRYGEKKVFKQKKSR